MESADEKAIFDEIFGFYDAWNSGDASRAASFYAEDGMRVGAFGDVQRGAEAIARAYDKLLHHSMPGATVKRERGSVRWLSSDLALWQAPLEIVLPDRAPLKGHVVQLMKRVGQRWLILESHPKLFPPPVG